MIRKTLAIALAALLQTGAADAHDMFLKFQSFFLEPNTNARLMLVNGTFDRSENAIDSDRMIDVSIVGPNRQVESPDKSLWSEEKDATWLGLRTGAAGTYVVGVSTHSRTIELAADDFNEYLEHDGVLDVLEARRAAGTIDEDANELYSKHVKAIYQVGEVTSGAWAHRLGYPIEIVPLANPYDLKRGERFEFQVVRDGSPVAGCLVYASYEEFQGAHSQDGGHAEAVRMRTDSDGIAGFELSAIGKWYVRLIHMVELDREGLTHESSWATLTFEVAR